MSAFAILLLFTALVGLVVAVGLLRLSCGCPPGRHNWRPVYADRANNEPPRWLCTKCLRAYPGHGGQA